MQTKLDKKNPSESYISPSFGIYDLHSLHGLFSGRHFVVS